MADVYKIGVGIALTTNGVEALGQMSRLLTTIDGQVGSLISKWGELSTGIQNTVKGLAQLGAGIALGDIVGKLTTAGAELVKYQGQLANLGRDQKEILADTAAARLAQINLPGSNYASNLKVLRELSGITATGEDARAILPDAIKAGIVLQSMHPGQGDYTDGIQTLVKAAELRGDGVDPVTGKLSIDRLRAGVAAELALLSSSGGMIQPRDLLGNVQQAGPMARRMSDPLEYWKSMAAAIMDMGGIRSGTAETALGRQLIGDKMTLSTGLEMERLGLYPKGSVKKAGVGITAGPLAGDEILKGPGGLQAWMEGVLIPAMKADGKLTPQSQQDELYKVLGTETARRLAGLFTTSQAQVKKDAENVDAASKQNLYGGVMGSDLGANISSVANAWQGLMQALGAPMVKPAISALQSVTGAINSLFAVFATNPNTAGAVTGTLAAGGAALTAMGGVNIAKGLFGQGGLFGAGTQLQTAATMLQSAAVQLGGRGVLGGGVSAGAAGAGGVAGALGIGIGGAILPIAAAVLAASPWFIAADADYRAKYGTGNGPQVFGRGGGAVGGNGRKRNPFAPGEPGVPEGGQPGPVWFDHEQLRKGFRDMGGASTGPAPAPVVNVPAPQTSVQTNVTIDGNSIKAFIQTTIQSAIGALGGMQGGAPNQNSGNIVPAIDGAKQ